MITHHNEDGYSVATGLARCDSGLCSGKRYAITIIAHRDILERWLCSSCITAEYPDIAAAIVREGPFGAAITQTAEAR